MSMTIDPDLNALWRTIYGEAEPYDELDALAIGWVVLNRVKWRNWPSTVRGVCYQPWQFSCWNQDNPRLSHLNEVQPDQSPWTAHCYTLAQSLIDGSAPADPTNGATHYYASYIKAPTWAKGKTPVYRTADGRYTHLFFNDIDTPAPANAREALDQERPVSEEPEVRAGKAGSAIGGVAVVSGAVAAVGPAVPVLRDVAEVAKDNAPGLLIAFGLASLIAIGAMVYARINDRRQGRR